MKQRRHRRVTAQLRSLRGTLRCFIDCVDNLVLASGHGIVADPSRLIDMRMVTAWCSDPWAALISCMPVDNVAACVSGPLAGAQVLPGGGGAQG